MARRSSGCAAGLGVAVLVMICSCINLAAAMAGSAIRGTGQVTHALDQHVMTEHTEQDALLHGRMGWSSAGSPGHQ